MNDFDNSDFDRADFVDPLPCPLCHEILQACDCDPDEVQDAFDQIESQKEREDTDRSLRWAGISI